MRTAPGLYPRFFCLLIQDSVETKSAFTSVSKLIYSSGVSLFCQHFSCNFSTKLRDLFSMEKMEVFFLKEVAGRTRCVRASYPPRRLKGGIRYALEPAPPRTEPGRPPPSTLLR
jgi:hypothetical protein